jgi:hypothetical protein
MQIQSIGIDLGKTTFHLIALGDRSQIVVRKKFSSSQFIGLPSESNPGSDRHGGWGRIAFSGPGAAGTGAPSAADSSAVCATVREVQ